MVIVLVVESRLEPVTSPVTYDIVGDSDIAAMVMLAPEARVHPVAALYVMAEFVENVV